MVQKVSTLATIGVALASVACPATLGHGTLSGQLGRTIDAKRGGRLILGAWRIARTVERRPAHRVTVMPLRHPIG